MLRNLKLNKLNLYKIKIYFIKMLKFQKNNF